MADFKTHIGASTTAGIAYAVWGYSIGAPLPTCVLAGGLCSVSGMLPDLDSDSGVPSREGIAFAAAVTPGLMLDRFKHLGLSNETIALVTGAIYVAVRFGIGTIFKKFTVHRGMWHSIPACFIAGFLTFLICEREATSLRVFFAVAVMLGFFSHLLLDELWSVNLKTTKVGLKTSWGTAMKFFGDNAWANFVTYALLLLSGAAAIGDPMLMQQYGHNGPPYMQHADPNMVPNNNLPPAVQETMQSRRMIGAGQQWSQ